MRKVLYSSLRCGLVLAAGEGKRVQSFVHRLRGDLLPKQYVTFTGTRSMLEHTFHRAEKLIPAERLFTVVSRTHLGHPDIRRQLAGRPKGAIVVQPDNKDTGPGILLPLMYLFKKYPRSTVVVFPSDHFIVEEDRFMEHVESACRAVERGVSRFVLLGIEPSEPEPEYGYILPGRQTHGSFREVLQFIEKPEREVVLRLLCEGGLWNTMVMVFKARSMIDLVCRAAPQMYRLFANILDAIGTNNEMRIIETAYRGMEAMNFSKGLMEKFAGEYSSRLAVLPVRNVYWSDWGSEQRILSGIRMVNARKQRRPANHKGKHRTGERSDWVEDLKGFR